MDLAQVLAWLEQLAPARLAERWDNVGLLVDPAATGEEPPEVERVMLTIDLTEAVLEEVIEKDAQLVVAYHPPIFGGVKRVASSRPLDRVLARSLYKRIAVYSPHTSLDVCSGGVNDWLVEGLGPGSVEPLIPREHEPELGVGRRVTLDQGATLDELTRRIKAHLNLERVRVAACPQHARGDKIHHVALCAGAGGAAFDDAGTADLFWTGEMRHHDVLARVAAGSSVILCDHTNTERGYLPRLAARITAELSLDVLVSQHDRDPLEIV